MTASGLRWSWLDVKLGVRMLIKYPGLTLVGGFGLAIAIAIAAGTFGVISAILDPRLPIVDGDRVVAVENVDVAANQDRQSHLHDLELWRVSVPAVVDLGASRTVGRNLITPDGRVEPVPVAEMTASGFRIVGGAPLLGRYLVDDDERPAAAPVVVLGFAVWQSRFAADPDVVGKTLQLGNVIHAIVGVMPEGFGFPVNHRLWTSLRLRASEFEHGRGPGIDVFGRLAPGATLAVAQEQLRSAAEQLAATSPESHRHLRTLVAPYPHVFLDGPDALSDLQFMQGTVIMLLLVIGTNVAVLVYARTATRAGEITLRTALGASRTRVVTQFFAEALVLSGTAAIVGLAAAWVAFGQLNAFLARTAYEYIPFWLRFGITPGTVIYVAGLAILAAAIVGVVPALKATGRHVQAGLQRIGAGGSGMRVGRVWTVMIIAQVTVTVALMPTVVGAGVAWLRWTMAQRPFPTNEFLTATVQLDREDRVLRDSASERAHAIRYETLQRELLARLEQEPGISTVVQLSAVPGQEPVRRIDLDRPGPRGSVAVGTAMGHVAESFFAAFQIPTLAGRLFDARDFSISSDIRVVIVNEAFVHKNLGAGNALGRKLRLSSEDASAPQPWLEVVGVVSNFPQAIDAKYVSPRLYLPLFAGDTQPITIAARAADGNPAALTRRVRDVAVGVDPSLRLEQLQSFDESLRDQQMALRSLLLATAAVSGSALLLSAAGIYAIVSLTVTRRRREIAVRLALGAESRRVLGTLLARALAQIGIGVAIGVVIALYVNTLDWTGVFVVAAFMFIIGAAAAIGPARRGLRIQPTDALKAE
jgi:putative ABC transport system permease protein